MIFFVEGVGERLHFLQIALALSLEIMPPWICVGQGGQCVGLVLG